jgi:hypothetical protein
MDSDSEKEDESHPLYAKTILERVYDLLKDPKGWLKHRFCNDAEDAFCLSGAFRKVVGNDSMCDINYLRLIDHEANKAYEAVLIIVENDLEVNYRSIPDFNDAEKTTHQDVLDVLNKAISVVS